MAIFGLGNTATAEPKKSKKAKKTNKSNDVASNSQNDEAKALLEKMEAKKDADECPFC